MPLSSKAKVSQAPLTSMASSLVGGGDYSVLKTNVDQHRSQVMEARLSLASSLDRLGEHHVRQKQYDDAMDVFTEALHEKRTILSIRFPSFGTVSMCESDGVHEEFSEHRDEAIDNLVHTLRNMGNVHSMRGEHDEAMRYYAEVTNLGATKSTCRFDLGEDTTSMMAAMGNGGDDTSTMMSEISEDVKALDDMFRSISFRSEQESNGLWSRTRKSNPLGSTAENCPESPRSKRRKSASGSGRFSGPDSEPFRQSTSSGSSPSGNELGEALETYRLVLVDHKGVNLEHHKECLNSFALRADISSNRPKEARTKGNRLNEFELALEIYKNALSAQEEAKKAAEEADSESAKELSSSIASTIIRMGSLYYKLGNRVDELRMYEEAKNIYLNTFGENHAFVAGARKNIGMVFAERGEHLKAVEQFERAKQIYLVVCEGDEMNRDVASAISCLGNVKNRLGELKEALDQYMEALEIYKAIQEKAATPEVQAVAIKDVTATLKVIGMVRAKMGDLDAAMTYFKEAMALLRSPAMESSAIGREIRASVLARMGSILVKKGDLDKAMDHYKEAYDLTVRNRGTANHQEVASILHYIGGIFHKKSDFEEAMNCYQEAIRIYHQTLGPGNPTSAGTLVMVGSIHYKRKNLDSAMMFYREALRLNRDAYGLHHPDVAPILKSIGTILTKKGRYKEAYDAFRDVLSIKSTIHGSGHCETASAYKSLGNIHYKMGELADAEQQYRHALSIYRRTHGEEHKDTIAAQTTIEHIRYWMRERGQKKYEEDRHSSSSERSQPCDEERH